MRQMITALGVATPSPPFQPRGLSHLGEMAHATVLATGTTMGAAAGGLAGVSGGPAVPVTIPGGAVAGGLAGYGLAEAGWQATGAAFSAATDAIGRSLGETPQEAAQLSEAAGLLFVAGGLRQGVQMARGGQLSRLTGLSREAPLAPTLGERTGLGSRISAAETAMMERLLAARPGRSVAFASETTAARGVSLRAPRIAPGASEGTNTALEHLVPGRVQSRINLETDGIQHLTSRHLSSGVNASQFSIPLPEVRTLLQSRSVVSTPISSVVPSERGLRYIRQVDIGHPIGFDKYNGNQPTSMLTVMTDRLGNLISAFPGA